MYKPLLCRLWSPSCSACSCCRFLLRFCSYSFRFVSWSFSSSCVLSYSYRVSLSVHFFLSSLVALCYCSLVHFSLVISFSSFVSSFADLLSLSLLPSLFMSSTSVCSIGFVLCSFSLRFYFSSVPPRRRKRKKYIILCCHALVVSFFPCALCCLHSITVVLNSFGPL